MEQDEHQQQLPVTAGQLSAMETYMVRLYTGPLSTEEFVSIEADKTTTATDILRKAVKKLRLGNPDSYEIAEVLTSGGQLCKERRLEGVEHPVCIQLLWRRDHTDDAVNGSAMSAAYRFYIRKKDPGCTLGWVDSRPVDHFLVSFLVHPTGNKEYPDLCNLPDLNERTLLENLRARFRNSNIYTYVGSILIALNPFKFFPIYNPKYVKMYQNKRLGELPPHIFAIADAAYHTMLRSKQNQCIVISGESGSGKTESTNLLLHHLTALSHKGLHGSGVEQTILGAGPVLEAFGNAKTVHNNNSSRFGKFIQVNYKENGMVHGAIVEKYLLEKTRIVSQAKDERNYHVFYYLLAGATEEERRVLELKQPADYFYLSQSSCYQVENPDDEEFQRLKQSMEMVGFSQETQRRIFSVLSAVLHLGNIEFRKKGEQHRDESVAVKNDSCVFTISNLLKVKERTLIEALTQKKTVAGDETVVINYRMEDAVATRDAMAKCLYGALFDWIVLKVNQALLAKKHNSEHQGNSIGVLDIFGFEDFGNNSFEQFCINYANEHLQYYFNQHIFKLEQEEYQREGIQWKNIEFIDNTACLELFSKRNVGLFSLLDEECNFPAATNESLLSKFTHHHRNNVYYEVPQRREGAFVIVHYAGKVKYYIKDFREKNSDLIRTDIVGVLKKSSLSFVREIMGIDPVAVLRWAIVRAFFRCFFAFINAGKRHQTSGAEPKKKTRHSDSQLSDNVFSDNLLRFYHVAHTIKVLRKIHRPGVPSTSTSRGRERVSQTNPHVEPQSACYKGQDDDDDEVIGDEETVYQRQVASSLFSAKPRAPQPGMEPGCLPSSLESSLPESEARLIRKARKVMMKNKSFKPKPRPSLSFHDIKTLKAIASRTMFGGTRMGSKTRPPSVGVQFQWSLARLMTTLNQANPFFIRCIKSNGEKAQCVFDDEIVLRQLRYTGMLATVRIRQSGYNYRLTFEEFIQLYKILLPRGLLSSKEDVWTFLQTMDLNTENFQIGKSKVFLRESEKIHLDEALHKAIMERVVRIQRWMKTILERQNFLRIKTAVVIVQKYVRRFMAQRQLRLMQSEAAAVRIQQYFRAYQERCRFLQLRGVIVTTQALCRGYLARRRFPATKKPGLVEMREALRLRKLEEERAAREEEKAAREEEKAAKEEEKAARQRTLEDMQSSTSDEGVLLKGSSAEELEKDYVVEAKPRRDSEESSGILEDSETEPVPPDNMAQVEPQEEEEEEDEEAGEEEEEEEDEEEEGEVQEEKQVEIATPVTPPSPPERGPSPPPSPPSISPASPSRDPFLEQARSTSRVQELAKSFQQTPKDEPDGKTIFIRRGSRHRRVRPHGAVAPLAKQESFSDLELSPVRSPPDVPPHATLPPEQLRVIEETVARNREKHPGLLEPDAGAEGRAQGHLSPFHRAKQQFKNLMGGNRPPRRGPGDSDEDNEESSQSPAHRPHHLGVQVLPAHPQPGGPGSAQSPSKEQVSFLPQDGSQGKRKRKKPRRNESQKTGSPNQSRTNWKIARTTQWQYPADLVINELSELQALDEFIGKKYQATCDAAPKGKRMNVIDKVFKGSIEDFRKELKALISVEAQHKEVMVRYRDLLEKFEEIVWASVKREHLSDQQFPTPMIINSFRSFLDEFRKRKKEKKKDDKKVQDRVRRDKAKKEKDAIQEHLGHKFMLMQFNIPTFCELCNNLMWIMEKGQVCQVCKFTCHKKCLVKATPCKGLEVKVANGTESFGVPLERQVSGDMMVPSVPERLINAIETHGMFTEGVYRKSGAVQKARMLKNLLDTDPKAVNLDEYQVHVIATTLKSYLRELPEPLLTFELYDDFLRAAEIKDERERIQSLFAVIKRLPKVNYALFERLIFHLARVSMHQDSNKMTPEGLAIIFAPCLLRCKEIQVQDAMKNVNRQNMCIEYILSEQLKRVKMTLEDINTLESAENTASERLSRVRQSMRTPKAARPVSRHESLNIMPLKEDEDEEQLKEEEKVLSNHIKSIHEERNCLTYKLPMLEPRQASSDEDALTGDECESIDLMNDDDNNEEFASSFDFPASHFGASYSALAAASDEAESSDSSEAAP